MGMADTPPESNESAGEGEEDEHELVVPHHLVEREAPIGDGDSNVRGVISDIGGVAREQDKKRGSDGYFLNRPPSDSPN